MEEFVFELPKPEQKVGEYRVLSVAAQGGQAVVYRVAPGRGEADEGRRRRRQERRAR